MHLNLFVGAIAPFSCACLQEKLVEAAKAQVRRMCTVRKKRVGMNLPPWVLEEYRNRPKSETARLLMSCNFDKARLGLFKQYIMLCNLILFYYQHIISLYSSNNQNIQEKFINTLEVIVKKKSSKKMTVDSEWVSEKEMRDELNWSACLVYINFIHQSATCKCNVQVIFEYIFVQNDLSLRLTNLHWPFHPIQLYHWALGLA